MYPLQFLSATALETIEGLKSNGSMPILQYLEPMRKYLPLALISENRERLCHFLAQLAHESGGFFYDEELASGHAYENRLDLGNNQIGDGVRYKGRGLIQLTGRQNYSIYGQKLGIDLISNPDLAKNPDIAVRVSVLYWSINECNVLADSGDFHGITRKINGGLNGLHDRWLWLNRIMTAYDRFRYSKKNS